MLLALTWIDHAVIAAYLVGMLAGGVYLSRRQKTDEEYFLAGRRMPWMAVGVSVIASLLSSLTYLSEPGEVWNSGVTHVLGKMLAIPIEMAIVWLFCVPFLMRFRFTSAYEYLEHRFGRETRTLGVGLFILMVVLWMGFVVLVSSRALAEVTDIPLEVIIVTVGLVATVYTVMGGLRAVIWTDVVQVVLLIGGGLFVIGFVAVTTGTWLPDWYEAAVRHLDSSQTPHSLPLFSWDPTVRATVVTVAINMTIWHVCTHVANQMTVQRYFSTASPKAARRSFLTASLFGVGLNLMLMVVGLAVLYYYFGQQQLVDGSLDLALKKDRDLIFPTFAVHRLPAGCGGAILAALLAAAMSSIDSGINSIATVLSEEWKRRNSDQDTGSALSTNVSHVRRAKWITLVAGLFITAAAYGLDFLPGGWGIVDAMPRTFNAVTVPLGGLFLVGMFLPSAGQRSVIIASLCGLLTSVGLGYFKQIGELLHRLGILDQVPPELSFTWIMPCSLLTVFLVALLASLFERPRRRSLAGLTWVTRNEKSPLTDR